MDQTEEQVSLDFDLRHYLQIALRRRWIILSFFVLTVSGVAFHVQTQIPVYKSTALILIEKEQRNTQTYGDQSMVQTSDDSYYQTQYHLLRSKSLLSKVHRKLNLNDTQEFAGGIASLGAAISASPVGNSRLVNISADSQDPVLARDIANALAREFVDQNIESKLFISKEIMGALFPTDGKRSNAIATESIPAVVNSALIQTLKSDYAGLETKKGELLRRYREEHPERQRLEAQMQSLKSRIDTETDRIVRGMKAELSGQLLGNNVRIIDPAETPTAPYKPNKRRTIALAVIAGFLGGFFLALGIDMLDQTLHSQEDVEQKLKLPFLGAVPMAILESDSAESYSALLKGPKSFSGESLKNIRTMVGFAAAGKKMKSILITSSGQGEGKSFIAMTLAMVFSQLGERVLLIEGDLRRPSLHKRFRLSKEKGLSHFLAHGQNTEEVGPLIKKTENNELDVLVCGHLPPNPSELLSTPRLQALLAWAEKQYDRVIIDGTPVFPITDALLWAQFCDAAVFVVKFGGTNGNLAAKACEKLRNSGIKLAGSVVNQVTAKANSYYGGYYYYYYYYHSDYTDAKTSTKA